MTKGVAEQAAVIAAVARMLLAAAKSAGVRREGVDDPT
jgi:hypothetical protein